jgi:hypothetical protein
MSPCGSAGVEHVEVVRRHRGVRIGRHRGERVLIVDSTGQQSFAAAVVDLQQHPHEVQLRQEFGQGRGEARVVLDRGGPAVKQQVTQLLDAVPVVDVDRRQPAAERAKQSLEVGGAVVQVLGQEVLPGLVPAQEIPFPVSAQAVIIQEAGQAAGPVHQLGVAQRALVPGDRGPFRHQLGSGLDEAGDRELHCMHVLWH